MDLFEFSSSVLYEGHEGIGVRGKWSIARSVEGGSEMTFEQYCDNRDYELMLFSREVKTKHRDNDLWKELYFMLKEARSQRANDMDNLIEYDCMQSYLNSDPLLVKPSDLLQKMYELSWQPY